MGLIDDIPNSELLSYQDIIDILTLFHANKEDINLTFINDKARELGLSTTLSRLLSVDL